MKIIATRDITECDICEGIDELGVLIVGGTHVCEQCIQAALEELHGRDIPEARQEDGYTESEYRDREVPTGG